MKIILTKPVKTKDGWHKADSEISVTQKESKRLMKKRACVQPLVASTEPEESEDEDKE